MSTVLSTKAPGERVFVTIIFSGELAAGETLLAIQSVSVSTIYGYDPLPSAILYGSAMLGSDQASVVQEVTGGIDPCYYDILATCLTSSGQVIQASAILPIQGL